MKKWFLCSFVVVFFVLFIVCLLLVEYEMIKIGIVEFDEVIWNYIVKKVEEVGLDIQLIFFFDYVEFDIVFVNKEIDVNVF